MISDPAAHWMDLKLGPPTQESRETLVKREKEEEFSLVRRFQKKFH